MQATIYDIKKEDLPQYLQINKSNKSDNINIIEDDQQKIIVFDSSELPRPETKIFTFADNSDPQTWPDVKAAALTISKDFNSGTIIFNRYTEYAESYEKLEKIEAYEGEVYEGKLNKLRRDEQGFVSYYELIWSISQNIKDVFEPAEPTIQDKNNNIIQKLKTDEKYGVIMPNITINILFSGSPCDSREQQTAKIMIELFEICKNRPVTINCISFANKTENNIFYSNLWRNSPKQGVFLFGYDRMLFPQLLVSNKILYFFISYLKNSIDQPCILYEQEYQNSNNRTESLFIRTSSLPILKNNLQFLLIKAAEIETLRRNSFGGAITCRVKTNWSNITELKIIPSEKEIPWNEKRKTSISDIKHTFNNIILFAIFFNINTKLDKISANSLIKKVKEIIPQSEGMSLEPVLKLSKENIDKKEEETSGDDTNNSSDENRILADVIINLLEKIISRKTNSVNTAAFNNEISSQFCNLAHSFSLTFL
jgi:hypothetical protein